MNDSISQVKLGDFGLAVLSSANSGANAGDGQADATGGGANAASGGGGAAGGGGGQPDGDMHNLSRQDSITDCVGTHFYSAPEQRARGVHYDHKVDMYATSADAQHSQRPGRAAPRARDSALHSMLSGAYL